MLPSQKSKLLILGLIGLIVLSFTYNAHAQSGYYPQFIPSVPTPSPKVDYYSKFDGNPFLSETSMKANIITNDGNQYTNISVKYDLIYDIIILDRPADEEGAAPSIIKNVSTIMLKDVNNKTLYFESGFPAINSFNEKTLYQVMTNGSTKILKKASKSVVLRKVYSFQPVKEVVASNKYFIYRDNKMVEVKKSKNAVLSALSEKQPELESYIDNNHLNLKKDTDIDAVLSYYNTL